MEIHGMSRRSLAGLIAIALFVVLLLPRGGGAQQGADFFTVPPCRVYDTRWGEGPLAGGFDRHISIGSHCGIPPDATTAALTLTLINPSGSGLLSAYPCCANVQNIVQAVQLGRTLSGSATLRLSDAGQIAGFINGDYSTTAGLAVDVTGYFRPTEPIQQWREWQETLLSPADYTLNGGDPYSEVELDIRFTNTAAGLSFVQPAFWDGDDLSPRIFKVRTAVPAGNWTWKIESCTRNSASCLSGWAPSQGSFVVQSNTASGNPFYDRGFIEQVETLVNGQVVALSAPQFPDGSKFDWLGDTAWAAPPREISGQTNAWDAYIADRKSKGFTVIQIAPAVAWTLGSGQEALPAPKGFSFNKKAGCADTTTIPKNGCWVPNKQYWDRFTTMVRKATEAGLMVAVVGVMNPVGIDSDQAYPDPASANTFARELVGRLSAFSIMFSPAFDDDPGARDPLTQLPRSVLMNAVGSYIREKIPKLFLPGRQRALSNLLAGADSTCDEYQAFGTSGWMTHYLFQSGHGGRNTDPSPLLCAGRSTDRAENAMERARVMPLTLSTYTPKLPAINGEGPYDDEDFVSPQEEAEETVDIRYRVRQAGYLSSLSNAVGFTYGADGLTLWDKPGGKYPGEPAGFFGLFSSDDMKFLKANFQGHGLLVSHPEWILNNPNMQKYKMVLASNEASFVMAYLPGDKQGPVASSSRINIDATKLPCQVCPSQNTGAPWTVSWINPETNRSVPFSTSCSRPIAGQLSFQRPDCSLGTVECDWLLKLEKTGPCPSAQADEAGSTSPESWSDTSIGDGTSAIYAARRGPGGEEEPILLSPAGKAFQVSPRVSRVKGYDLVVWQADGLDGSLAGIYGSLISPQGEVLGPFKINHYTENDQREPAVAGRMRGEALVVWSSYGQDGDRGGIYGRLVKPRNKSDIPPQEYLGEEFEIAEVREGHQQHPQVLADAGGYWVAWETMDENGLRRGVSVRRLGLDGHPVGAEIRLPAAAGEQSKLLALDSPTPDSVAVRWWRQEARGGILESLQRLVGPQGPLGPVTPGRN